jgi:hypothetical protein
MTAERLSRFFSKILPTKHHDLRNLLSVGDSIRLMTPLSHSAAVHGDLPNGRSRIMEQIEDLTAGLVARQAGPDHNTAGFCVHADDSAVHPGRACTLKAEVTEVTPSEAMFKVDVIDASNGAVIGTADYSRVLVAPPYRPKI